MTSCPWTSISYWADGRSPPNAKIYIYREYIRPVWDGKKDGTWILLQCRSTTTITNRARGNHHWGRLLLCPWPSWHLAISILVGPSPRLYVGFILSLRGSKIRPDQHTHYCNTGANRIDKIYVFRNIASRITHWLFTCYIHSSQRSCSPPGARRDGCEEAISEVVIGPHHAPRRRTPESTSTAMV